MSVALNDPDSHVTIRHAVYVVAFSTSAAWMGLCLAHWALVLDVLMCCQVSSACACMHTNCPKKNACTRILLDIKGIKKSGEK